MKSPRALVLWCLPLLLVLGLVISITQYFRAREKAGIRFREAESRLTEVVWGGIQEPEAFHRDCDGILSAARSIRWGPLRGRAHQAAFMVHWLRLEIAGMREELELMRSASDPRIWEECAHRYIAFLIRTNPDLDSPDTLVRKRLQRHTEEARQLGLSLTSGFNNPGKDFLQPPNALTDPTFLTDNPNDELMRRYSLAIRYVPRFAPAYLMRGALRVKMGDASGALEDLREALRLDSTQTDARRWSALALEKQGRIPEAIQELDKALAEHPDYTEARELRERLIRQ